VIVKVEVKKKKKTKKQKKSSNSTSQVSMNNAETTAENDEINEEELYKSKI
jgi:hypothetical protein